MFIKQLIDKQYHIIFFLLAYFNNIFRTIDALEFIDINTSLILFISNLLKIFS